MRPSLISIKSLVDCTKKHLPDIAVLDRFRIDNIPGRVSIGVGMHARGVWSLTDQDQESSLTDQEH